MNYIGGTTALVVTVFSVYRFATGDWSGGLTNAIIVTMVLGTILLGQLPRFRNLALMLFGLVSTVSCLLSALLVSSNGLLWTYIVLWINLLILPRRLSAVLNLTVIVILTFQDALFTDLLHRISWSAVAVMFSVFGLVFVTQLRSQRKMLARLASQDPLTGAGNRRLMQHRLETAVKEHSRRGRPATLVVLDLDLFKELNDQHGHEAGDLALQRFATDVRQALRQEDGLYRMGGEEFVLLLPDMDDETASRALPELHRRLSGGTSSPSGPLRFSAGAATIRPGEGWSRWLARADRALYQAKASGRDRLAIAD